MGGIPGCAMGGGGRLVPAAAGPAAGPAPPHGHGDGKGPPPNPPGGAKARLSCQLCGRMFGQMEDLRRHFRTHTGEKPYTCPYCPYRAAVKSSVIRHARTIHGAATPLQMGV
ncbi:zinc finger protein [Penaeus vannamei]|uniref:Zinc finger protein n=1 Tax=Penaeus vannamei TaxID=6689 RepID=A0A423SH02_PENVA|nr:zinc finger protein [Penaeus vannamei]